MLQKIHDTLTQAMTMAATAASRQQLLQRTLRKAVAALNPPRAAAISARDHREDRDREDGSNEVRQQEPIQWENHAFFWWEKHGKSWKITSFDGKTMRKSWTIMENHHVWWENHEKIMDNHHVWWKNHGKLWEKKMGKSIMLWWREGAIKRANWGYPTIPNTPYSMGSRLELLRVSQLHNSHWIFSRVTPLVTDSDHVCLKNGHSNSWIFPVKLVIFYSDVKLPGGRAGWWLGTVIFPE